MADAGADIHRRRRRVHAPGRGAGGRGRGAAPRAAGGRGAGGASARCRSRSTPTGPRWPTRRSQAGAGDRQRHQRSALRPGAGRGGGQPRAPIILMHMRGRSDDMYQQATYHDVVGRGARRAARSVAFAPARACRRTRARGSGPGIRQGRHPQLRSAGALRRVRRAGPAGRDGAVAEVVSCRPFRRASLQADREWPTAAAVAAAVLAGAHIVRVHAVARDGPGGAGSRRDSEVSSRPLMTRMARRPRFGARRSAGGTSSTWPSSRSSSISCCC